MTAQEMLTEVNNAIYAICVGGQSYKIGSRQLKDRKSTRLNSSH